MEIIAVQPLSGLEINRIVLDYDLVSQLVIEMFHSKTMDEADQPEVLHSGFSLLIFIPLN